MIFSNCDHAQSLTNVMMLCLQFSQFQEFILVNLSSDSDFLLAQIGDLHLSQLQQ